MSSHHFVREFQEPAVYFHSFRSEDMDQLGALLEWSPYVIAHESCIPPLQEAHVKVDAILRLDASPMKSPMMLDESILYKQFEKGVGLEALLRSLLPHESVGLHIVDTAGLLCPTFLADWPAGFALLYHTTHRWMQVKASGYSKWWPEGTRLKVIVMEPATSIIPKQEDYRTAKDGLWEWPYTSAKAAYLGEPYW